MAIAYIVWRVSGQPPGQHTWNWNFCLIICEFFFFYLFLTYPSRHQSKSSFLPYTWLLYKCTHWYIFWGLLDRFTEVVSTTATSNNPTNKKSNSAIALNFLNGSYVSEWRMLKTRDRTDTGNLGSESPTSARGPKCPGTSEVFGSSDLQSGS